MKVKREYWVYHIILFKGCVFTGGLIKFVTVTLKKNHSFWHFKYCGQNKYVWQGHVDFMDALADKTQLNNNLCHLDV